MVVIIEDSKENSLSWSLSHKTCQDRNRSIFHPRQLWLRSKRGMSGFNSRIDWTNSRGYGNNQVDKGGLPPLGKAELIRAILDTAAGSLNPEAKGFDKTVRDLFPILNEWNPHAREGRALANLKKPKGKVSLGCHTFKPPCLPSRFSTAFYNVVIELI